VKLLVKALAELENSGELEQIPPEAPIKPAVLLAMNR
jgi:hypothetical protein